MSVVNPVRLSIPETLVSSDERIVDERTARTIQQYQVNHQEEFLRLRAQVEALLSATQIMTQSSLCNLVERCLPPV
jgi:hypothetical protein